ncbi:hypothetical protein [Mycolicibacterium confluentis]|uniref:Uncharacterized protein n=1 Tax=Mycolicibacterium confluentis TaxID=28047 RepID=A0A7I7XW54_9MYCO|nr:hypothetical protein [Mycolicibacterium confluentis]MCV7321708.1 hypothetical protein [Mycolicibacterium confluentis]ORV31990.1 hypothetical protein AWB99_09925 [Mycolicibacterium confluentis]BBZ33519.1 hypothetical protein MCNF_21240 [Mycolicibacterium confluentis]
MRKLIVGTQALAAGTVTEYELRRWYRRVQRNIYVPKGYSLNLEERIDGAWLRTHRRGVVAGQAAAALYGARWIAEDIDVEMIWDNTRPPAGIVARDERTAPDEITVLDCVTVTTPERTAFDLARHIRNRYTAIARLDALKAATGFEIDAAMELTRRYRGARGVRQARELLPLVDGGAASPPESRIRLKLIDGGLPRPATQVPAVTERGWVLRMLDMGWEKYMVAVEYDGVQHQTDRAQYLKDQRVLPKLAQLGWKVLRVFKEDNDDETVERARRALLARGWDGKP